MPLVGARCTLRAWLPSDAEALVPLANDPYVARYLSQYFPLPYTATVAESWVRDVAQPETSGMYAIDVGGELVGGIGSAPGLGDRIGTASLGYWVGRRFWGRGIATEAVALISEWAFRAQRVRRISATVMAPNRASARVLDKNGFSLEARLHDAIVDRAGAIHDELIFVRFR